MLTKKEVEQMKSRLDKQDAFEKPNEIVKDVFDIIVLLEEAVGIMKLVQDDPVECVPEFAAGKFLAKYEGED